MISRLKTRKQSRHGILPLPPAPFLATIPPCAGADPEHKDTQTTYLGMSSSSRLE